MITINKKTFWSIVEQFGGTGILYLILPVVSRFAGPNTVASYALTITITAIATIYSGGVILRAKELNTNHNKKYSTIRELIKTRSVMIFLSLAVSTYVLFLYLNGKLSISDSIGLALICIVCVLLEIQNATAIVHLKTFDRFNVTACSELISKLGTVIAVFLFYRFTDSIFAGAIPVLIGQVGRFAFLFSANKNMQVGESKKSAIESGVKNSSIGVAIIYGITSYVVANGEKIFSSFSAEYYLETMYALAIIPTLIPTLVNSIRITTLGQLSKRNEITDKSFISDFNFDLGIAIILSIIAFIINPFYLSSYKIPTVETPIWQINLLCCTAAVLQSANISSFYKLIISNPAIVVKVVIFSGCIYGVLASLLILQVGIIAILIAKNIFFILALCLVYFARESENEF